jgi:hypothetical protein
MKLLLILTLSILSFKGFSIYGYKNKHHPDCLTKHAAFYSYCPLYKKAPFPDDSLHWCVEKAFYKSHFSSQDINLFLATSADLQQIRFEVSDEHKALVIARRQRAIELLSQDPIIQDIDQRIGLTRVKMGELVSAPFLDVYKDEVKILVDTAMLNCGVSDE